MSDKSKSSIRWEEGILCWICKDCGATWSGMMGDNAVPETCPYCEEDSEQAQAFDRAFDKDDDTLALLKRVLGSFDLDIYAEGSNFTGFRYTGRLWEEGETVCECSGANLLSVLQGLDRNAEALVSAYNM